MSRTATSFGRLGERRASKRSSTALATLLTFCPPGPEERTNVSTISLSSMRRSPTFMERQRRPSSGAIARRETGVLPNVLWHHLLPQAGEGNAPPLPLAGEGRGEGKRHTHAAAPSLSSCAPPSPSGAWVA